MKKIVPVILTLIFLNTTCNQYKRQTDVENVGSREVIVLKKDTCQQHIHKLEIRIIGEVDGKGKVSLFLDRKPYVTSELSGKFDIKMYSGDWYSDTARIVYEPDDVKKGNIKLIYQFFD